MVPANNKMRHLTKALSPKALIGVLSELCTNVDGIKAGQYCQSVRKINSSYTTNCTYNPYVGRSEACPIRVSPLTKLAIQRNLMGP